MRPPAVIWHELECHAYAADLPLWRGLAAREEGPVLDVGAGTGRVARALAAEGHEVVALDRDPLLLAELDEVETVVADAQDFSLGRTFGLILVPMQTIQLLEDRRAFLRCARAHLAPGGLLAMAIADALEAFDPTTPGLPEPDVAEIDGWRFSSQPVALRELGGLLHIDRVRTTWFPDGRRVSEPDRIALARLDADTLEREAEGFTPEPPRLIDPTDEHVGSTVVMLRA
jgi:SAM-dependent methyltransferase